MLPIQKSNWRTLRSAVTLPPALFILQLFLLSCGNEAGTGFEDGTGQNQILAANTVEVVENPEELDALRAEAQDLADSKTDSEQQAVVDALLDPDNQEMILAQVSDLATSELEASIGADSIASNVDQEANPEGAPNQTAENADGSDDGQDSGVGAEGGQETYPQELVMVQPANTKVDILWIIDSSMSMSEEQVYLGANFSSFITALTANNSEFQTAVTSTDVCQDTVPDELSQRACPFDYGGDASTHLRGAYVGDVGGKVLEAQDPNIIAKFNTYTQVGTNGSNFEHGLRATSLAVEKDVSGENENLVRADAFLSVIIISDEEDDGVGLNQYDPFLKFNPTEEGLTSFSYNEDQLITYLNSVKGQGRFSISTITGTKAEDGSMCSSPHSNPAEEGRSLINAANKTGGSVTSICDTNWSESLQQMGQDLNSQISQVNLGKVALKTTVKVFVNDIETSNWTFIEGNNSVKFNSDSIPAPGSSIKVTYQSLEQ